MIRLRLVRQRADTYAAYLGDLLIISSRQPIFDGARQLIKMGYAPEMPMTVRHQSSTVDSIRLTPIGELAKWTTEEPTGQPVRRRSWKPRPDEVGGVSAEP